MAAPQISLTPLNPNQEKWKSYMIRFRQFLMGNGYDNLEDNHKRALFLAHCGSAVLGMAIDLVAPRDIEEMLWSDLQEVLQEHYVPIGILMAN